MQLFLLYFHTNDVPREKNPWGHGCYGEISNGFELISYGQGSFPMGQGIPHGEDNNPWEMMTHETR